MFWVCDTVALKQIANDRHTFPKRPETYQAIMFYGPNVVSAEGQDWRRHRDATKAAFGESNNQLVWAESMRTVKEWFEALDSGKKDMQGAVTQEVHGVMTRLALLIISAAGFGRHVSFMADEHPSPPPGYKMAFRPALLTAVHNMALKVLAPRWAYSLPIEVLKNTDLAYSELKRHLEEMISRTRAQLMGDSGQGRGQADLFKRLISANEVEEEGKAKLNDSELLSNTYTFLLAGHETTANALSFACALLAMHPEVQRKLQAEADTVWPDGLPVDGAESYREDVNSLKYAEAVFRETTRLFPAETRLSKMVSQDTRLKARKWGKNGKEEHYEVVVPQGSTAWLDIWATHMSPEYWGPDVNEFKPERFFDTDTYKWPRDAYLPFMIGPRSCMGQRFAELEGRCVLAHIASQYDILLPPELENASEEEKNKKLLSWDIRVALTAKDVTLRFVKRANAV
ncbi:cytochrome P450 [Dacryopinax primogenitus]|uniref:Cytochrome P450 n=1 Tax=Dacryopinax primogenitus (strain DJM 731) TaxID=1858805 RepID=M5FW02_DACPD|nr:cytochrome P450 [Dacryopinax primogenitus]EJT99814.1 cytochrome P450 [Dacryopinax primogenitus]